MWVNLGNMVSTHSAVQGEVRHADSHNLCPAYASRMRQTTRPIRDLCFCGGAPVRTAGLKGKGRIARMLPKVELCPWDRPGKCRCPLLPHRAVSQRTSPMGMRRSGGPWDPFDCPQTPRCPRQRSWHHAAHGTEYSKGSPRCRDQTARNRSSDPAPTHARCCHWPEAIDRPENVFMSALNRVRPSFGCHVPSVLCRRGFSFRP